MKSAAKFIFSWLVLHVTQLLCVLPAPPLKLTLRHIIMNDGVKCSTKAFLRLRTARTAATGPANTQINLYEIQQLKENQL